MSKRVYELAKELGLSSRDVLTALSALGVVARSHSSTVDDDVAAKLKEASDKGNLSQLQKPVRSVRPARPARPAGRPAAQRPSAERTAPAPAPAAPRVARPAPAPVAKAPEAPLRGAPAAEPEAPAADAPGKIVSVHRGVSVQDLAAKLGVPAPEIVKKLFTLG